MSTENSSVSKKSGVGFLGLLCIAFIVLKLVGVIAWSWWWVLSPVLIPFIFAFIIVVLLLIAKSIH